MQEFTKSISFDGREIRLKTGLLAPQAGGSVLIESGETAVLVSATTAPGREGIDFLPLLVDYEERLYAAGRIPGSYMRREGRPPERAVLVCRLIDRPMRPLFPKWFRDDIQIVATTMSMAEDVPPDVLAVTGASIATLLAGLPFHGPMAAVRVGLVGDDFILNPTYREILSGDLDLVVAGTPEGSRCARLRYPGHRLPVLHLHLHHDLLHGGGRKGKHPLYRARPRKPHRTNRRRTRSHRREKLRRHPRNSRATRHDRGRAGAYDSSGESIGTRSHCDPASGLETLHVLR